MQHQRPSPRGYDRGEIAMAKPNVAKVILIGIGGSLAAPPLPHHRAYGSVHGGSSGDG